MFETLGSHSRQTIHMHTQNGSHLKISWKRNFDSHLRIKDITLKCFPICLYREAMHLQCFPPTCYVRGGALRTLKRDDYYQLLTKIEVQAACLHCMVLLCTQLDYMVVSGQFFSA